MLAELRALRVEVRELKRQMLARPTEPPTRGDTFEWGGLLWRAIDDLANRLVAGSLGEVADEGYGRGSFLRDLRQPL